jgi:hypothetical protein
MFLIVKLSPLRSDNDWAGLFDDLDLRQANKGEARGVSISGAGNKLKIFSEFI